MSYRSDALEAFDCLTDDGWAWLRPQRVTRDQFRDAVAGGRIDAQLLLHNIAVVERFLLLDAQAQATLDDLRDMPVLPRNSKALPKLRVVA